ncbi:MAG: hypothetical protein ABJE95_07705 [Byssovorax sp.]
MRRRRAWIETLPFEAIARPDVVRLLASRGIEPIVAVWPATPIDAIVRVIEAYGEAGQPAALWPMLSDGEGRWANAGNAGTFVGFVEQLCARLTAAGHAPAEIVVDLEPSIEAMRASFASSATAVHMPTIPGDLRPFVAAQGRLAALCDALHAEGIRASSAAPPTVLLDPREGHARPFQEVQGTPIDGPAWDHVSFMLYTSILEGWSRGVLRRGDARALLGVACRAAKERLGDRAGASIGAVGVGAFGNEPVYRGVAELADDVAIALAAGVDDLALFDLGGVIQRAPPEPWLDAFVSAAPLARLPEPSWRLRSVIAAARLAGGVFGALGRGRGARRRAP